MLNPKQIASMQPPVVDQVWFSESTHNYWLVNETCNQTVRVTRLAFEYNGNVYRVNKPRPDSHWWNVSTFKNKDLRVVGTNPTRFNSWLNRVAK